MTGGADFEGSLIARGEQFQLRHGDETYTGEVHWSWADHDENGAPLDPPRRIYPIAIHMDTIRGESAQGRPLRLSPSRKQEIATALRILLLAREPEMQVDIV